MNPMILYNSEFVQKNQLTVKGRTYQVKDDNDRMLEEYPPVNVLDMRPYIKWKPDTPSTSLDIHLSGISYSDTIGISGHNLGTLGATLIVWVTLIGPSPIQIANMVPSDNSPIMLHPQIGGNVSKISLEIVNPTLILPEIGVVNIGKSLEFPFPPDIPFIPSNEGIISETLVSKSGKLLGIDHRFNPLYVSHRFSNLERTWIENEYLPFWNNHGKLLKPFFYAPDLENLPNDVYFCRFSEEGIHSPQFSNLNYADSLQLNLVGAK